MLQSDKDFIKYYDKLFLSKDYCNETNYILEIYHKYGYSQLNNILDLGCGTGSHTLEFSKLGYQITGLDLDPLMIKLANEKSNKVKFEFGDIKNHNFDIQFELIFSFFNVLNYISDINNLTDFLDGVYRNLEIGGVLVFDGWNGNRICIDPPEKKEIIIEKDYFFAKGFLMPNYDKFNNVSNFQYKIDINDHGIKVKYENTIPQTYWPPLILKQLLNNVGFSIVHTFSYLSQDIATIDDYKLCWVCIKN